MRVLVRITLHLDAFEMVEGGAWEINSPSGKRIAMEAWPAFSQEATAQDGAGFLAGLACDWLKGHPTLF